MNNILLLLGCVCYVSSFFCLVSVIMSLLIRNHDIEDSFIREKIFFMCFLIGIGITFHSLHQEHLKNEYANKTAKHFKISSGEVFRLDSSDLEKNIYYSGERSFSAQNSVIID